MKELIRFRQFLNEEKDPIGLIMEFVSNVRELLNDPKAGIHPKMLNYLLDEMRQFTPFLEIEEYMMHVEQAAESYQQDDMEGTKMHLLDALASGETAYKNQVDQYLD